MRCIVNARAGGTEVLSVEERPDPQPGREEVRIAVKAAGLNFADILARQGLYPDAPACPMVVGYEVAGEVDQLGAGVDPAWLGKPVIALSRFNGHSSHVCVSLAQMVEKPASLSWEQGAAIPVVFLTAWQLLVIMGSLRKGDRVLIHNAGGGVGLAALDIARHIGAETIGTASPGKHAFLRERGLAHAINYRTGNWLDEVMCYTGGKGVELVIDPLGGDSWKKSYKALRSTGRLGMFGVSSVTDSGLAGKLKFLNVIRHLPLYNPISLMNDNKSVFGVNMGHLWHEADKIGGWLQELMAGVEAGWVRPHVDKTFRFDEVAEAHRYIEGRGNTGKVILLP